MLPRFVHLRLHSEYSVVDSILTVDGAVGMAAKEGMPALALTDLSNMFGMVKFYSAARKKGIKPILGADVWVASDAAGDKNARLLMLVQNLAGYHRLCEFLTRAYRSPGQRGKIVLRREWLAELGTEGLIALSGAQAGDVGQALMNDAWDSALSLARSWDALFPGRYYLEIQRNNRPDVELHLSQTVQLAGAVGLPVVATHTVQFPSRDDFKAHEAKVCIAQGYVLADRRRPVHFTEDDYFKTQDEMCLAFADLPEAVENTLEIARRCNLTLELGKSFLPDFPTPAGMTLDDYLRQRASDGLNVRLSQLYPDDAERASQEAEYRERLEIELKTIIQMGFPGYFLIVADFINWAKHNGVPVGPGRGSGAGSLVAYSIGITDLDPLRYALLFERFLNPERVSMPDFDIDFCQDNRWKVIEYVREKYGADAVSQIVTFGTMAARAVVRDVGRVLDLPYNFCDALSKMIPSAPGKNVSLDQALAEVPELRERYEKEEEVKDLFDLARKLEGLTRNVGMHAGGVLIAPGKLTDFCPLYCADGSDSVVSQLDKDDVEKIGLVKFDFLGLRNLTIIDLAVKYIRRLDPTWDVNLDALTFDDPAAYNILKKANTTAIFQLESEGMKKLLAKLEPDRIEDVIAVLALYRPGPLGSGMVEDFIQRKKGKQSIDYFHPDLKACLEPTYGVIVYQEQVMQISQIIGGYTLGGADLLRRAMGKKKAEEMAKHRDLMREGAKKKGYDEKLAMHLFDLMEKFAEYGFNKSHTAAYAVISYQTAWLKAHHTAAFMAATLSSDLDDTDSVHIFYDDAVANGLEMLGPDVNHSEYRFYPVNRKQVRYGLGAIKGTGESAIASVVAARMKEPFTDIFDFCQRVDRRLVNRRVIEALVRAGAFDSLHDNRAALLNSVGLAMEWAETAQANAAQNSLFSEDVEHNTPSMADAPPWALKEQLANEKAALGFYISGHPFSAYRHELAGIVDKPLSSLAAQPQPVLMAGVIMSMRTQMTRRGKMAFVTLDDMSARMEVAVYNELFESRRDRLKEDNLLIVQGKVSYDDYAGGLRITADALYGLDEARMAFAERLTVTLNGEAHAERLLALLQSYRAGDAKGCPVTVNYTNSRARCAICMGEAWNIRPADSLLDELKSWLSGENVALRYAPMITKPNQRN
jgi:DNA polymerase-3 subunit alpha